MEGNKVISNSFVWMCIGLLVTFVTGYAVAQNANMLSNVFGNAFWVFIVLEFILVIVLSARVMKMSPTSAKVCFILYSFVSGLTFSSIFVYYELTSILIVFLLGAVIFGVMACIGYNTKVDLTKIGFYFLIGILGVIILSIINVFMGNTVLDIVLSVVCLILFLGVTAYDVQKIKALSDTNLPADNLAIYGALQLYLDFINIFLQILELFNNNKD